MILSTWLWLIASIAASPVLLALKGSENATIIKLSTLKGVDNSYDLRVNQYPDQPIDEVSTYVVTTRFMCILALQDYFGD